LQERIAALQVQSQKEEIARRTLEIANRTLEMTNRTLEEQLAESQENNFRLENRLSEVEGMNETSAAAQMRTFLEKGVAYLREVFGHVIQLPDCNMRHRTWTSKHPGGGYIYTDRTFCDTLWQEMKSTDINQPLENQLSILYRQMHNRFPNT